MHQKLLLKLGHFQLGYRNRFYELLGAPREQRERNPCGYGFCGKERLCFGFFSIQEPQAADVDSPGKSPFDRIGPYEPIVGRQFHQEMFECGRGKGYVGEPKCRQDRNKKGEEYNKKFKSRFHARWQPQGESNSSYLDENQVS